MSCCRDLFIQGRRYQPSETSGEMSTATHLRSYHTEGKVRILCKCVRRDSGEVFFHRLFGRNDSVLFPVDIQDVQTHVHLLYPVWGADLLEYTRCGRWTQDPETAAVVILALIEKLTQFHRDFQMAMGDIKPSNILYEETTRDVRYIDVDLCTAQPAHPDPSPDPVTAPAFSIRIPEARTQSYGKQSTPGYMSYPRSVGKWYDVFEDDRYALAATICCLLLEIDPPSPLDPGWVQEQPRCMRDLKTVLATWEPSLPGRRVFHFVRRFWV